MKNKKITFGIMVFFLIGLFFVLAVGEGVTTDYSSEGIEVQKIEGGNLFSINGDDPSLFIGENSFPNLVSSGEAGYESYIKADDSGKVLEADFTSKGGRYIINGIEIEVLPNSRVIFKDGKLILPDETKIDKIPLGESGEISFEGNNLNLLGEVVFEGEGRARATSNGYIIEEGISTYRGLTIDANSYSGEVLIVTNPNLDLSQIQGNWIKETKENLQLKSSEFGELDIQIRKENRFFDLEDYAKMDLNMKRGDGVNVERINSFSTGILESSPAKTKITYDSTEKGSIEIINGPTGVTIKNGNVVADAYKKVLVDEILEGRYRGTSILLEPTSGGEEIFIGDLAEIEIGNFKDGKFFSTFSQENQGAKSILNLERLDHESLTKIATTIDNNLEYEEDKDLVLGSTGDVLEITKGMGFNKDQETGLVNQIIEFSKIDSVESLDGVARGMEYIQGAELSPEEIMDFTMDTIGSASEDGYLIKSSKISPSFSLLKNSLDRGIERDLTRDFIHSYIDAEGVDNEEGSSLALEHYKRGMDEYNGGNFEEIKRGIETIRTYEQKKDDSVFEVGIKYSNIHDKDSLAKEYASAFNAYLSGGEVERNNVEDITAYIDHFHDGEGFQEGKDFIRNTIYQNLNGESKYLLMTEGIDIMYPSALEISYKTQTAEEWVKIIGEADPEHKNLPEFLSIAARDQGEEGKREKRLDQLLKANANFVMEGIKESPIDKFPFLTDAIDKMWNDPDYELQKEPLEEYYLKKYGESKTWEERANYAYLLKLNRDPGLDKINSLNSQSLEVIGLQTPQKWADLPEVKSKEFFVSDESNSFQRSIDKYKSFGYEEIFNEGGSAVLIGKDELTGKRRELHLQEYNKDEIDLEEIKKVYTDEEFQVVAFRMHVYDLERFMPEEPVNAEKIFLTGVCGGYGKLGMLQKAFPNGMHTTDSNTGELKINTKMLTYTMGQLANGETRVENLFDSKLAEENGIILPTDKGVLLYRYIKEYEELCKNNPKEEVCKLDFEKTS